MTGLRSNIDQVIERFKSLRAGLANLDVSQALIVGINAARGQMTFRIFNEGLDAEGIPFGKYRGRKQKIKASALGKKERRTLKPSAEQLDLSPYELKRLRAGRQIGFKDLEFSGTLRRGIIVISENERRVICAIANDKLLLIAKGQERQIGTTIFALSQEERDLMKTNINEALKQLYVRYFAT